MRRVRELTAAAGALTVGVALVLTGASTAVAGGPTSVLLVSPASGETASLYNNDEEYMRLRDLLPQEGGDLEKLQEKRPDPNSIGGRINITWMIHDVSPWRVDMVHPDVTGSRSIWISTQIAAGPEAAQPPREIWHKSERPDELRSLLTDLGVMSKHPEGSNPDSGPQEESDDTSAAVPPDAARKTPVTTAAAGADDGTDWWWAIPGLAAGLALGSGGGLLIRRAQHDSGPPREPRQELIDL
ncbi:hypothetical protein [Streptomyces sp. NBC_00286]|uniref:hypothetical protein n=1 Tax=Streptomyces sp. NBC_00286 TaxID=2975701 RepID=UPI002E2C1A49|nr:hypothetical protein [Streptomyces sp. NBC_00286]